MSGANNLPYRTPLVGAPAQSRELLTKHQGYMRASADLVEINAPGLFEGHLPWDKAKKIAIKGILDCRDSLQKRQYVRLQIPGTPERRGPPEQVMLFFRKMLHAATEAEKNAKQLKEIGNKVRGN